MPANTPTGQIFVDESENARQHLLVAAVAIEPKLASRLMGRFRKREKLKDEIKGQKLTAAQRQVFFAMMTEYAPEASAVVICEREHPLGGHMMGTLAPSDLWAELVVESCLVLRPRGPTLAVTPDGGRYTRKVLDPLEQLIRDKLMVATGIERVRVRCEPSEVQAGLQVADIIANSATHAARHEGESAELAAQLLAGSGVAIRTAEFPLLEKPDWLKTVA